MTEPPEGKSMLYSVPMFLNARSFFSLSKVVSIPKFLVSLIWWNFNLCVEVFNGNSSNINHLRLDSGMNSSQKSDLLNSRGGVCCGTWGWHHVACLRFTGSWSCHLCLALLKDKASIYQQNQNSGPEWCRNSSPHHIRTPTPSPDCRQRKHQASCRPRAPGSVQK